MKKDLFKLVLTAFLFCVMLCSAEYHFDEDKMYEMLFLSIFILVFLLFTSNAVDFADKLYSSLKNDIPDANTLRRTVQTTCSLDKDLVRDIRKAILYVAAEGRHSVKYDTCADNPAGSNTKSVRDYLLSLNYRVKVDPKGGKYVIIHW